MSRLSLQSAALQTLRLKNKWGEISYHSKRDDKPSTWNDPQNEPRETNAELGWAYHWLDQTFLPFFPILSPDCFTVLFTCVWNLIDIKSLFIMWNLCPPAKTTISASVSLFLCSEYVNCSPGVLHYLFIALFIPPPPLDQKPVD